jgi:hypothetical protein
MLKPAAAFLVFATAFALTGCSSETSESGSDAQDISQDRADITILKIEPLEGWLHVRNGKAVHDGEAPTPAAFDTQSCSPWRDGELDCSAEFASTFGAPAFHRIAISEQVTRCKPIRITTASKKAAVAHTDGVGTHYTVEPGSEEIGDFIEKSRLAVAGEATAKNGDALVLHRFVALGYCDRGGRFGSSQFKPFMRFTAHGSVYDNWDNRPYGGGRDYRYSWDSRTIDRSSELLAP